MLDSYKHKGQRKQLIQLLREKGITEEKILTAMEKIPRHFFMDSQFDNFAYKDMAFKIDAGQTISQPFTVAFQTQLLRVEKGMKVLEIGTGSGYQTAVLAELGLKIFTIERQKALYVKASAFLPKLGYAPKFYFGDGYAGVPAFAPFDRILVTCGAPEVPSKLVEQLKPGGRMVIPVGEGETQRMLLLMKNETGAISIEEYGDFKFVPMLKDRDSKS